MIVLLTIGLAHDQPDLPYLMAVRVKASGFGVYESKPTHDGLSSRGPPAPST